MNKIYNNFIKIIKLQKWKEINMYIKLNKCKIIMKDFQQYNNNIIIKKKIKIKNLYH